MIDLGRLCVACHDAGGAELVSSFLLEKQLEASVFLSGPAQGVFQRKGLDYLFEPKPIMLERYDTLITGSSIVSNFEASFLRNASNVAGLTSIVILDHWINYVERFQHFSDLLLPDEIWLSDSYALSKAKECFSNTRLRLITNYYINDLIKEQVEKKTLTESGMVLYVSEPISILNNKLGPSFNPGYDEFEALEFLLENLHRVSNFREPYVVIKNHPSEDLSKYKSFLCEHVFISEDESLLDLIGRSEIVAGCQSMGLVVALSLGKPVVSCIPLAGQRCQLPHDEIRHLRDAL